MQIRCSNCHRPYALSQEAVQAALDEVLAQGLGHFNAPCPHCRRVNRVSREELQRAASNRVKASQEGNSNDAHT